MGVGDLIVLISVARKSKIERVCEVHVVFLFYLESELYKYSMSFCITISIFIQSFILELSSFDSVKSKNLNASKLLGRCPCARSRPPNWPFPERLIFKKT